MPGVQPDLRAISCAETASQRGGSRSAAPAACRAAPAAGSSPGPQGPRARRKEAAPANHTSCSVHFPLADLLLFVVSFLPYTRRDQRRAAPAAGTAAPAASELPCLAPIKRKTSKARRTQNLRRAAHESKPAATQRLAFAAKQADCLHKSYKPLIPCLSHLLRSRSCAHWLAKTRTLCSAARSRPKFCEPAALTIDRQAVRRRHAARCHSLMEFPIYLSRSRSQQKP